MSDDGVHVLRPQGEIDLATGDRFAAALEAAAAPDSSSDVLVDLCGVTFMDSTGLQHLLEAQRRLAVQGRKLVVFCPPGRVADLFTVTDLVDKLAVHATRDAAVSALA